METQGADMRPVLTVIGVAIIALLIAVLTQKNKDKTGMPPLTPNIQERIDQRKMTGEVNSKELGGALPKADVPMKPPREGVVTAVCTVEGRGDIVMEFYPKAAPKTVEHIVS